MEWNGDPTHPEWVIGILPESNHVFETAKKVEPLGVVVACHRPHNLSPPTLTPHTLTQITQTAVVGIN